MVELKKLGREMTPSHRPLLLGVLSLMLLSGCEMNSPWGSSGTGSDYGSADTPGGSGSGTGTGTGKGPVGVGGESGTSGSDDSVVATASVAGVVSVAVGANQTISITFNS